MKVVVRYSDGCPNLERARVRLREALRRAGVAGVDVSYERVETPEDAGRLHFRGSPTFLIGERDPFADDEAPVGLACRIYQTESGLEGCPSIKQLEAVLSG